MSKDEEKGCNNDRRGVTKEIGAKFLFRGDMRGKKRNTVLTEHILFLIQEPHHGKWLWNRSSSPVRKLQG